MATTWKVYSEPLVSPSMVHDVEEHVWLIEGPVTLVTS